MTYLDDAAVTGAVEAAYRELQNAESADGLRKYRKPLLELVSQTLEAALKALQTEEMPAVRDRRQLVFGIAAVAATAILAGVGGVFGPIGAAAGALASGCVCMLLRPKPVSGAMPRVTLNETALKAGMEAPRETLERLRDLLNEQKNTGEKEAADLRENVDFARWVQMFALHAMRSGNHNVLQLYRQLKEELEYLGIYVYDELETDETGGVKLPKEDYFVDMRTGDEWTKVLLPVVYTDTDVLMNGQIL